jgi:hypothetical protein
LTGERSGGADRDQGVSSAPPFPQEVSLDRHAQGSSRDRGKC